MYFKIKSHLLTCMSHLFLGVIHYRDIRNPIFNSPPKIQEKPNSHPQTPHPGHTRATATHPTAPSLGTGAVFLLKTAPANHSKSQQTCCLGASASLGVGWRNERFNDSYLPFWIPSASSTLVFWILPGKQTWPLKDVVRIEIAGISRGHVSFRGCNFEIHGEFEDPMSLFFVLFREVRVLGEVGRLVLELIVRMHGKEPG